MYRVGNVLIQSWHEKYQGLTAKVVQFPMRLCFGTTAHKFQGQTVIMPNMIGLDLKSVFAAARGYVMISRVQ